MSSRHETREEGRAVPVADAAPGDTVPMVITASGNHGIPVLITPTVTGATASFQGFLVLQQEAAKKEEEEAEDPLAERKKWFREMRGWLMVLATVAASVAYQAGLNPPGGFWQDNNGGHRAGNPVLRDQHWVRYILFYYFQRDGVRDVADLASLVGAYIAGTTRYASSCVYIVVITCVSFVCVIYIGEAMGEICAFVLRRIRCMRNLAKLNWCPVPAGVVTKSLPEKEAEEHRKRANERRKRPWCPCCAPPTTTDRRDVEGQ
ncbi:hypothetical protein ACQ4PT_009199 [Festuca glaucescens]